MRNQTGKIILISVILSLGNLVFSCGNPPELSGIFYCKSVNNIAVEKVDEFEKNFTVSLPVHWRTELYSMGNQSGIMTADTTRFYSDSYLINLSWVKGALQIGPPLRQMLDSILYASHYTVLKDSFFTFHGKPSYVHWSEGERDSLPVHILQQYIKVDKDNYILNKCEFFGEKHIREKLCEALQILETIHINKK